MLKIFRRIREKLLDDRKLGAYLLYALGEIILVVAGILIALQINNWNEEKKNRQLEINFYTDVLEDLEKDEQRLTDLKDFYQNRIERLGWLLDAVRNPVPDPSISEFGKNIEPLYYNMEDVQYASSFESARSSGAFSSFSNKDILKELTQFYADHSSVQGILRSTLDIINVQFEPITAVIPLNYVSGESGQMALDITDYANPLFYEFLDKIGDSRSIKVDLSEFLQKPEFENYIVGDLGRSFNGMKVMTTRIDRLKTIKSKITTYLYDPSI